MKYRMNSNKSFYQNLCDFSKTCKDVNEFRVTIKKHFWSILDTTDFRISKDGDKWIRLFFYTGGYLKKDNLKDAEDLYKNLIHPFKDLREGIPEFHLRTDDSDKSKSDYFHIFSHEIVTSDDKKRVLENFYQKFNAESSKLILPNKESTDTDYFNSRELAYLFANAYNQSKSTLLTMRNNKTELAIDVNKNNFILRFETKDPTYQDIQSIEKAFNNNSEKPISEYHNWTVKSSLWYQLFNAFD